MKKNTKIVAEKKASDSAASPADNDSKSSNSTSDSAKATATPAKDSATDEKTATNEKAANSEKLADKTPPKEPKKAQQKPAAKPETSKKPAPQEPAENASNNSGKIALIISIIALGAAGFQFYQAQLASSSNATAQAQIEQLKTELTASIASVSSKADAVKSEANTTLGKAQAALNDVNTNLKQLKAAEAKKSNDIDDLQNRLTKSIQQVESSSLKQNSRKDWLLAEVEYLLRLANQRVLMENTPIGALALLKSADKILQQTDDVSIFSVRKALAADMSALAAVPHIDQEGLYLKMDALSNQINQLKLVPLTDKKQLPKIIDEVATDAVKDAQAPESSFAKAWSKASAKLEKLVVISHRDSAIEPLLSPAQQAGLLQKLHILFEQTQLALLQRKQAPYQRSIEKAEQVITTYFQAKDGATIALLDGLKELKGQQVNVELPSIAGSLNTLKAYLKQSAEISSGAQN